jgi:TPR repeat protein
MHQLRLHLLTPGMIALALMVLAAPAAIAEDYERGLSAYNRADYATALLEWDVLAQFGDPKAQFGLGVMHTFGQGVPKDDTRAMDWYRRAAERGHAGAQLFLGHGLESGNGAEQNLEAAFFWFLRAAEQGEARAQNNLGRLYETGRGTNRDLDIALYWYEESARNGNTNARKNLARLHGKPPPAQ